MTTQQGLILGILLAAMGMFFWGRWRHDMVAVGAMLVCVMTGLVPAEKAFSGLGHPAVVTVACVLVLSYALQITGAVDILAQRVLPKSAGPTISIVSLMGLCAVLSAFMNNVGALALLMPLAVKMAEKHRLPAGKVLMPLAFASILGGMTTLIGTPSNLIVSGFRVNEGLVGFKVFDFTPVGVAVAVACVLFVGFVGWRLVPSRRRTDTGTFDTAAYLTEVRIQKDGKTEGKTIREIGQKIEEADAQIVAMVRDNVRIFAPYAGRVLKGGDILVIEAEPKSIPSLLSNLGLSLEEDVPVKREEASPREGAKEERESRPDNEKRTDREGEGKKGEEKQRSDDYVIRELVAMPDTSLIGRSASDIRLRTRYRINLLAISRQGRRSISRLRTASIRAGDVLLMQGSPEALSLFASEFECVPLAQRDIRVPKKGHPLIAGLVMLMAVIAAALGLVSVAISFAAGVLVLMAFRVVQPRSVYQSIDWPVIVLLAAMLPVAGAMKTTEAADLIARFLLDTLARGNPVIGLAVFLVVTMLLTDFMNNAATAALMCPIGLSSAHYLGVNPDTFLMAAAIGSSCAFMTPIGHQSNTLILGPGGFRFGDYWRMGFPTDILVVSVALPMLLWIWPL